MAELRRKLKWALAGYAGIALLAAVTLRGALRWIVLIVMGAFALKSWIAVRKEELEESANGVRSALRR